MKKKNKRIRKSEEYQQVLDFLIKSANKHLNYKQIASQLKNISRDDVKYILDLLVRDNKIEQKLRGKYVFIKSRDEVTGKLDFNQRGDAYLVSENLDEDIKLKKGNTLDAFNGDEVSVKIVFSKSSGKAKGICHQNYI